MINKLWTQHYGEYSGGNPTKHDSKGVTESFSRKPQYPEFCKYTSKLTLEKIFLAQLSEIHKSESRAVRAISNVRVFLY